jgi:capsular polysaccharide biosynthesis protein
MRAALATVRHRLRPRGRSGLSVRDLQPVVEQALETRRTLRVAALVSAETSPIAASLGQLYPSATVVPIAARLAPWKVRGRLAGAGPLDVVLDIAGEQTDERGRFCSSFLHLAPGGMYFAPEPPASDGREHDTTIRAFLNELQHERAAGLGSGLRSALANAIRDVRPAHSGVVVVREGRALATLPEREMNQALAVDATRGRVLDVMPGESFASRCQFRESGTHWRGRLRKTYKAPRMFLREYRDVVCAPSSVVVQRNVVTPDSFRRNVGRNLLAGAIENAAPGFAAPPVEDGDLPTLEGAYFHLDNECRGHFGHALTEQVSRLWAWQQAKAAEPGLRLIVGRHRKHPFAEWERVLLRAAGIEGSDTVLIDQPVHVERLLSARQMYSMPAYIHPRIVETWDRVGASLRSQAPRRRYSERIFIARRIAKRPCTNADEVEALFRHHGFEVVYPEDYSLPEQAQMFHAAEVVGGYAGSGMIGVLFSDRPKHLVVVGSSSYRASNEYMISAVRGHRLDMVTCESSIPQPAKGASRKAKNSAFTCDMTREGAWLRGLLGEL